MNNRRFLPFIILGVIAFFIIAGISSSLFYTINATQRAVIFYKFGDGLDKDNVIQPGFHTKAPWNELIIFEVSEITSEENMDINDKNGLQLANIDKNVDPATHKNSGKYKSEGRDNTQDRCNVHKIS